MPALVSYIPGGLGQLVRAERGKADSLVPENFRPADFCRVFTSFRPDYLPLGLKGWVSLRSSFLFWYN